MLASEGHYYGALFKGSRGVTQGDLLSPNILNMVVDAGILHWAMVVAEKDAGP